MNRTDLSATGVPIRVGQLLYVTGEAPGSICAVPKHLVNVDGTVDLQQYFLAGWASLNCGLNQTAIGSHLYPRLPAQQVPHELAVRFKEKLRKVGRYADNP